MQAAHQKLLLQFQDPLQADQLTRIMHELEQTDRRFDSQVQRSEWLVQDVLQDGQEAKSVLQLQCFTR